MSPDVIANLPTPLSSSSQLLEKFVVERDCGYKRVAGLGSKG